MKKHEIKNLWEKEKKEYTKHEIGSGVQNFVNEILMSNDIFKLKKGELSTNDNKRKNEFLLEKTKKQKRADIIIFISNDIIIPVEVEKYKNIKAGEQQIFNYQKAWNKKYGILTDGYIWRFYNNKIIVREFTLDEILNKTSIFLTFWNEYTQIENYYLQFFEKIAETSKYEDDLNVEQNRQNFFTDITKLIDNFRKKLNLKGYFTELTEIEKNKKSVEISYAYFIQFILYKTLADNDFHTFGIDFTERLKRIHKSLEIKDYGSILFVINTISKNISKNIYKPFTSEQKIINETLEKILAKPQNKLQEITPWLDIFVFIKQYNFANIKNEIFGFIYENYLKQLYADKNKGQYFTAPEIVDFMLTEIGYSPKNLINKKNNEISIIDPSCGSGTFLYSAVRNIINTFYKNPTIENAQKTEELITDNIFGLDIEEFPLYLAEMSVIMKMLPLIINKKYNSPVEKKLKIFKTKDSIAEFLDVAIKNTIYDTEVDNKKNKQQMSLFTKELNLGYPSYVRDEDDLKEMKQSIEDRAEPKINRFRFDYVIGNPPYIDYNSCSKLQLLFTQFIKTKKLSMGNVYGINLNTVPKRIKPYSPKPNLYSFFIALGLALLKDNGIISFIIPQNILISGDLDVIRYHLSKYTTIEKLITFSGKMFIGRGLKQKNAVATSSLIFIISKKIPNKEHKIKIINYSNGVPSLNLENYFNKNIAVTKEIYQTELYKNIDSWMFITKNNDFVKLIKQYKENGIDFNTYRNNLKNYDDLILDGSVNINKKDLSNNYTLNSFNIPIMEKNKRKVKRFLFCNENRIKKAQGSRGFGLITERNYKIIWKYQNPTGFYYVEKENTFPKFMEYCIASYNKTEILFIFSLLNSKLNSWLFKSLLLISTEKSYLLGLRSLKKIFRIPIINSENLIIKNEIIEQTSFLLELENKILADFIDFNNTMLQEIDKVEIAENNLIIYRNKKRYKLSIDNNFELIKSKFQDLKTSQFSLQDLKEFEIVDNERINKVKKHIDNLIFALYFKINILQKDIKSDIIVQNLCEKNKYYEILS